MTKLSLAKEEIGSFDFKYCFLDDYQTKPINKFVLYTTLSTDDPTQVRVVVTSPNFNGTNYPTNSRNRLLLF